jgi:serine/threonine-protein kinase RsbW
MATGTQRLRRKTTTAKTSGSAARRRRPAAAPAEPVAPSVDLAPVNGPLKIRIGPWRPSGELLLHRAYPSRLDLKQQIIDLLCDLCVAHRWITEEDRPWLVLCLDEAVTNAMLHGNEGDPRLTIEIAVSADARNWHIAISDRGDGFNADAVPDPDDPESLLLEHGRGIRLMRAWLGSLTYWRRGATVVMSRRRAEAASVAVTPPPA